MLKEKHINNSLIIFTDLDGTLLDSNYSFRNALPALRLIRKKNIPLILCSSKTRTEIEHYRKRLKNIHPFISENGGGIFVPKNYFKISIVRPGGSACSWTKLSFNIEEDKKHFLIRLGAKYSNLRKALQELRDDGFDVRGFGDMSIKEITGLTSLKTAEAKLAKQRDFDEPFVFKGSKASLSKLKQNIKLKGLTFTQGKFFHIKGKSDKGRAVSILKKLYNIQNRKIITIALGDSPNDIEMLQNVDYPIVVQEPDGFYDKRIKVKKLIKADGIGPEGWNKAVMKLLELHGF